MSDTYTMGDEAAFDAAVFYDVREDEQLTWTEPEEAIADWLHNDAWEQGESLAETIARVAPVEVTAFRRMAASMPSSACGAWVLDCFEDEFAEENGSPDARTHDFWTREQRAAIIAALDSVLAAAGAMATVWRCEDVAKRLYTEDELRGMFTEAELAERGCIPGAEATS